MSPRQLLLVCVFVVAGAVAANGEFLASIVTNPVVIKCSDTCAALAGKSVSKVTSGSTSIFLGYNQVNADNQDPVLIRCDNGQQTYCRTDIESNSDDGTGVGLLWDTANGYFWGIFTSKGTGSGGVRYQQWSSNGWIPNFFGTIAQSNNVKVSVVIQITAATGTPINATFVGSVLSSGKANTLLPKAAAIAGQNPVVWFDAFYQPVDQPGNSFSATRTSTCSGSSPLPFYVKFNPSLSQALEICGTASASGAQCTPSANTCPQGHITGITAGQFSFNDGSTTAQTTAQTTSQQQSSSSSTTTTTRSTTRSSSSSSSSTTTTTGNGGSSGGGCFASTSLVRVLSADGQSTTAKRLADVAVGDLVESVDDDGERLVYSEVFAVLHRDADERVPVVEISTANGATVRATPQHLLLASASPSGWQLHEAAALKTGAWLLVEERGQLVASPIVSIQRNAAAVRAPLTLNNRIVVDRVAASVFSFSETLYAAVVAPLKLGHRLLPALTHSAAVEQLIDVLVRWSDVYESSVVTLSSSVH